SSATDAANPFIFQLPATSARRPALDILSLLDLAICGPGIHCVYGRSPAFYFSQQFQPVMEASCNRVQAGRTVAPGVATGRRIREYCRGMPPYIGEPALLERAEPLFLKHGDPCFEVCAKPLRTGSDRPSWRLSSAFL